MEAEFVSISNQAHTEKGCWWDTNNGLWDMIVWMGMIGGLNLDGNTKNGFVGFGSLLIFVGSAMTF